MLEAANVTVVDPRGHQVVKDVSFEARAGEVLGIAGVQGNGQTELIKSLLGPDQARRRRDPPRRRGHHASTARGESLEDGIGYIPEDRSHDGFVGAFSVRENLVLDLYRNDEFSRGLALQARRDRARTPTPRIEEFDIRTETHGDARSARSPAATSRRSSSPGSSPGRSRC